MYTKRQRFGTHWGGGGGVCILRDRGLGHTGEGVGELIEVWDTLGRGWGSWYTKIQRFGTHWEGVGELVY